MYVDVFKHLMIKKGFGEITDDGYEATYQRNNQGVITCRFSRTDDYFVAKMTINNIGREIKVSLADYISKDLSQPPQVLFEMKLHKHLIFLGISCEYPN